MGLKIKLRPGEKVYINGALVENGSSPASLQMLNRVTLLREKDILLESECDTPCKKVYFILQGLYFSPSDEASVIQGLTKISLEIVRAAPSTAVYFEKIIKFVSEKKYYTALKEVKELIKYEGQLLNHAKSTE